MALINSNLYIALAAVFFTIETQIQLGISPHWHPYLFIIFFATFLIYNLHRLIVIFHNTQSLRLEKYSWVRKNQTLFLIFICISILGLVVSVLMAKKEVLFVLFPIALITFFYSTPIFSGERIFFNLREIPFLKIFLIAAVWSSSTIFLPVIESGLVFNTMHLIIIFVERFFFIFSITIPFDIRDIESDKQSGLQTIPMLLNEEKSIVISFISLSIFFVISFFHYRSANVDFIMVPLGISYIITFFCLYSKKLRNLDFYHHGILDGTILLQAILVIIFYQLK